jgi:hypothetical protein
MEGPKMKINRWLVLLLLILAGGVIYVLYPLLIYGMELLLFVMAQGISFLWALPQILWWLSGAIFLTFWGLKLWLPLGESIFSASKSPLHRPSLHGRLSVLRQTLDSARSDGSYSQDKVRQLLRLLATDLIALKLDISEEEARKRFFQGDWTQDHVLKAYLYKEREFVTQMLGKRFLRWLKRSERPVFLEETREVVDHLKKYRDFSDGGK